jgi:hypothetical protein
LALGTVLLRNVSASRTVVQTAIGAGWCGLEASVGFGRVARKLDITGVTGLVKRAIALLCNSVGSIGNESLGRRGELIFLGGRGGFGTERGILKLGKASVGHGRVRDGGGLRDSLGDLFGGSESVGGLLHVTI